MNLPFVSRAVYEDVKDQRECAERRVRDCLAEIRRLTNVIIDMKVTGATVRAAVTGDRPRLALAPKPESELDRALRENDRTRHDPRMAARMRAWAEDEIASGRDAEDVIDRVRNWNAVAGEAADDDDDEALTA